MTDTKIEWTDKTWNPIVGCSVVSPGCTNCYAMRQAHRLKHMLQEPNHYFGTTKAVNGNPVWTGHVAQAPDSIFLAPLKWKKPARIFVNSMGDLFHESVPDAWIDRVFAVMALAPQHTFQVLTKRSKRMREYLSRHDLGIRWVSEATKFTRLSPAEVASAEEAVEWCNNGLPNVHLGVSAEDQTRADERIPDLLATPAAVRFVSAEPLLGPIDFHSALCRETGSCPTCPQCLGGLDWVIVGGESGKGARPMELAWARSIISQCESAGVACFMKQLGSATGFNLHNRKGGDPDEWPAALRVRQMPEAIGATAERSRGGVTK